MIKMIVFDMAGTTVDEDNVVYKTVQLAVNEAGYPVTLEEVLAEGAGKEKLQAIRSVLEVHAGVRDEAVAEAIFGRFEGLLTEAYADLHVSPQPHAVEVFGILRTKGIRVVLNTGYSNTVAQGLVDKLGWVVGREYDALITASEVKQARPYPDMILLAMERFGIVDGGEVVKVGDSIIDIEEGQNAGCGLSLGITTGAHTREQLLTAGPDAVIGDLRDLLPLIR